MRLFVVCVAALAVLCSFSTLSASAQLIPIPQGGYPAFKFSGTGGSYDRSPIIIDFYFDLMCPGCKAMWANFQPVMEHYGDQMVVLVHVFPLPYHYNAFLAAIGAQYLWSEQVANGTYSTDPVFDWIQLVFDNQDQLGGEAAADLSQNDVIKLMSGIAHKAGLASASNFTEGLNDPTNNGNARVMWKAACQNGVTGTPSSWVNGALTAAEDSWGLKEWKQLLSGATPDPAPDNCPSGQESCEWSPGKIECCTTGENCIPNVGCRC
jgi:protein-disulfide isomerase